MESQMREPVPLAEGGINAAEEATARSALLGRGSLQAELAPLGKVDDSQFQES